MKTTIWKNLSRTALCALLSLAAGCATQPLRDPFAPGIEKRLMVQDAIAKLVSNPVFPKLYDEAKKRAQASGKSLPVVQVEYFEYNESDGGRNMKRALRSLHSRTLAALQKTGLFMVFDPTLAPGVAISPDGIDYQAADFKMTGTLIREETGALSLELNMQDVRSALIFWSDVVTPSDSAVY